MSARLGKYELLSRIAAGGQAETFRAQLEGAAGVTKQCVIKKVLPSYAQDEAFIEAFITEAKLSAGLSHGNIAQVFEFGQVDGDYFLAMEWVDGRSLSDALQRSKELEQAALPLPLACFIGIEVCKALHYAHGKGIVHRDVSPENILIGFEGQTKVIDFGIAKAQMTGRRETEPGLVKGKFLYFSPEQTRAEPLDGKSDVFALGIVLYRMLTGVLPFQGQMHEVIHAIGHVKYPPLPAVRPNLPEGLVDAVTQALAKDAAKRSSALELQQALTAVLYAADPHFSSDSLRDWMAWLFTGKPRAAPAPTAPVRTEPGVAAPRPPSKPAGPWVLGGVGLGVVVALAVAAVELTREAPEVEAAKVPTPKSAPVPLAPKAAPARDALVFPGTPIVRADRHRVRFDAKPLPVWPQPAASVMEKAPFADDSPLFVQLSSGETVLVLAQPTALPASTASLRAFDLRPFGEAPRKATRTLDLAGTAFAFTDEDAVAEARWFTVEGVPADRKVRLTLRPVEPARWEGRPRVASAVVVWKRAFGRLPPPPGSPWPDAVDRAVLLADRPLVLERATALAFTMVDGLAVDEKDSVLIELFDTGEPASTPDPKEIARIANAHLEKTAVSSKRRPVRKTIDLTPAHDADRLFDEALTHFERGQYALAKPKVEDCIAKLPGDFECHKLLGSVLTALGDTRGGAAAYKNYLKLAPRGDPDVPKVRALVQLSEGRP